MVERARLEIVCAPIRAPWVQIPLSAPNLSLFPIMATGFFVIKRNPPAMPVDKGKTTKALAAARSRYTKKLLCAKLNVRLATVHK